MTAPSPALTREALTQLRKHDLEDGPCWCDVEPNRANGWSHVARCRQAKAAIGDDGHEALRSVLDVLIEWTPRLCEGKAKIGDVADDILAAVAGDKAEFGTDAHDLPFDGDKAEAPAPAAEPTWAHTAQNDPSGLYDDQWEPSAGDKAEAPE